MELHLYYCSHCGETKTFVATDLRAERMSRGDAACKTCLQGVMKSLAIDFGKGIFMTPNK